MFQNVRTLIFSTTFLTICTSSVHAMEEPIATEKAASTRARRCNGAQNPEKFYALYGRYPKGMQKGTEPTKQVVIPAQQKNVSEEETSESSSLSHQESSSQDETPESTEENSVYFKNFDVNSLEFQNVVDKVRKKNSHLPPDFQSIAEYFYYIPEEKKQEAVDHLEYKVGKNVLSKYKCMPGGQVTDTPTKIEGTISLRDHLLGHTAKLKNVKKAEFLDQSVQTSEDLDPLESIYQLEDADQDALLYQLGILYPSEKPYHEKEPLQIEGM